MNLFLLSLALLGATLVVQAIPARREAGNDCTHCDNNGCRWVPCHTIEHEYDVPVAVAKRDLEKREELGEVVAKRESAEEIVEKSEAVEKRESAEETDCGGMGGVCPCVCDEQGHNCKRCKIIGFHRRNCKPDDSCAGGKYTIIEKREETVKREEQVNTCTCNAEGKCTRCTMGNCNEVSFCSNGKRSAGIVEKREVACESIDTRLYNVNLESESISMPRSPTEVDHEEHRYPYCIVWTPIPCITWFLPFIGHMGIATSRGIIRDFAGSYYVSEDEMGFGWPTRIWQLDERMVPGGAEIYDSAVRFASDEYKNHVHNIFCDNCHSHVALALNEMKYGGRSNWNMIILAAGILFKGRSLGIGGFLKQWLPFLILCIIILSIFVLPLVL